LPQKEEHGEHRTKQVLFRVLRAYFFRGYIPAACVKRRAK